MENPAFSIAVFLKPLLQIDWRGGIVGEERRQAVGVVVVGVGEDTQVHAQGLRIPGKTLGSAGVQEDFVSVVFDVQGQPPLCGKGSAGQIVDQYKRFHSSPAPFLG